MVSESWGDDQFSLFVSSMFLFSTLLTLNPKAQVLIFGSYNSI